MPFFLYILFYAFYSMLCILWILFFALYYGHRNSLQTGTSVIGGEEEENESHWAKNVLNISVLTHISLDIHEKQMHGKFRAIWT